MKKISSRKVEKDILALLNELNAKMDTLVLNQKTLERRVGYLKGELLFSLREEIVGESDIHPNYYVDR
ncbi:MAG: hypothetical protein PHX78_03450 [bacterium]|nr:hypothetical protein [bacterium]